jgi:hypothetical protein
MPRKPETDAEKYQRKQRKRFGAAKYDLVTTINRTEPGLTLDDLKRLIDLVSDQISVYTGPDSPPDFRAWLYQCGLRFAHLWAIIKTNFSTEEWLLDRLPEFTGDVNNVHAIGYWVKVTQEQEEKRLRQNAELAARLFSSPVNLKAVTDGARSIRGGPEGEAVGLVYDWILNHGEQLTDSDATAGWPGRLYGLARDLALGWRKERSRDRKTFPASFDEKTCKVGYVDSDFDGGFVDPWNHATGPLPTDGMEPEEG